MADAIARLLAPFRTSELARVGVSRQTIVGWKYGDSLPALGHHDALARALVALRGGDADGDPAAVAAAKAEIEAAYREDLEARWKQHRSRRGREPAET